MPWKRESKHPQVRSARRSSRWRSRAARVIVEVPPLGLLVLSLFFISIHARGDGNDEIFADDFESGNVTVWSSSLGGGCELVDSEVPDCELEHGLGSWLAIPSAAVDFLPSEDSDGHLSSGSFELSAGIDGAELSLCFARATSGHSHYTRQLDARHMSGTLAQGFCFTSLGVYAGPDCDGEQIDFSIAAFTPGPTWRLHAAGDGPVPARARSFLLQIGCTGIGGVAVVRFDDLIVTAQPLGGP